jgi:hypothetical protein
MTGNGWNPPDQELTVIAADRRIDGKLHALAI